MTRSTALVIVLTLGSTFGCGGSCPEPQVAPPPGSEANADVASSTDATESHAESDGNATQTAEPAAPDKPAPQGGSGASAEAAADPEFPENASVDEAIKTIPRGAERLNLDPDTLAEPLKNPSVYESCKVGSQHFKLRVAVWNGRAVGVDVTTPNKKLADCVKGRVRAIEWRDKVRSLNTVEYSE